MVRRSPQVFFIFFYFYSNYSHMPSASYIRESRKTWGRLLDLADIYGKPIIQIRYCKFRVDADESRCYNSFDNSSTRIFREIPSGILSGTPLEIPYECLPIFLTRFIPFLLHNFYRIPFWVTQDFYRHIPKNRTILSKILPLPRVLSEVFPVLLPDSLMELFPEFLLRFAQKKFSWDFFLHSSWDLKKKNCFIILWKIFRDSFRCSSWEFPSRSSRGSTEIIPGVSSKAALKIVAGFFLEISSSFSRHFSFFYYPLCSSRKSC